MRRTAGLAVSGGSSPPIPLKAPGSIRDEVPEPLKTVANRKICASLFLQQVLYYQPFFSFGWVIFWMVWLFTKYFDGLFYRDEDDARTVLLSVWAAAEPCRIAAGYYGNLQENLGALVLYIMLTIAPHHGTTYYLLATDRGMITPVTKAVQVVQAIMLEAGFLAGLHAIWKLFWEQRRRDRLFEWAIEEQKKRGQPVWS